MLRPDPSTSTGPPSAGVLVLTCTDPACGRSFAPDWAAFAGAGLACLGCEGWTFRAGLGALDEADEVEGPVPYWPTEPTPTGEVGRDG